MTANKDAVDRLTRLKRNEQALQNALLDAGARKGSDLGHWGCPFHGKDRHGSLSIFQKDDVWFFRCHGCDEAGTIIDLVMLTDGIDARAAVKVALERYGDSDVAVSATNRPIVLETFDLPSLVDNITVSSAEQTGSGLNAHSTGDLPEPPSIPETQHTPARRSFARLEDVLACLERALVSKCTRDNAYTDKDGKLIMKILRFDKLDGGGKSYRPVHPLPDGTWAIGDPAGSLPLFNLPSILKAPDAQVIVVEGEKVSQKLNQYGRISTCSAHGSKSAAKTDWSPLAGRDVIIWPDHDEAGQGYAKAVIVILQALRPPARVLVVPVAKLNLPPGGDACDALEGLE